MAKVQVAAMSPKSQHQAAKGDALKPTIEQVLEAAESLYADELRPFGRILLKRIRERIAMERSRASGVAVDVDDMPLIDPKYLRKVCESSTAFQVEPAEGREYALSLIDRPARFVDPCSPVDPYPSQVWRGAAAYFGSLDPSQAALPSGRYACAQVLMSRGLAFLKNRSLGEVCHIVQLAISQKKILGYADGKLVPYSRSEECTKERCAVRQQPVTAPADELPYASWEDLRCGLRDILATSANPAPGSVTLSNVKRLFRAQLNLELSETVLGHSRVWELLQDPRLQDVCIVEAFGNGQAIVRAVDPMLHFHSHYHSAAMQSAFFSAMPPMSHPGMMCTSTCASNRSPAPQPQPQLPLPPRLGARAPLLSVPPPSSSPQHQAARPVYDVSAGPPGQLGWPVSKVASTSTNDDAATTAPSSTPGSATVARAGSKAGSAGSLGGAETASCCGASSHEEAELASVVSGNGLQGNEQVLLSKVQQVLRMASQEEVSEEESCGNSPSQDYIVKNTFIEMSPVCSGSSSRRTQSVPRNFFTLGDDV